MKRIYISGDTECTGEVRDLFNRELRPEINKFALNCFGDFYQFDDLWFKREEVTDGLPLVVALKRLQLAAPHHPYVAILGKEYGVVADGEAVDEAIIELDGNEVLINALNEFRGCSITETEIELAAYGFGSENASDFKNRTLFLIDPESTDLRQEALKKRIKGDFEDDQIIELSQYGDAPFESDQLKEEILTRLKGIISDRIGSHTVTRLDEELRFHRALGQALSARAVCRKQFAQQMVQNLYDREDEGEGIDITYVHGEAGTGKSCLLSLIADELEKDYKVCRIFCGRTVQADSSIGVAEIVADWLYSQLNDCNRDTNADVFEELNTVNELYSLDGDTDTVYVLIDGIDRLRPDSDAMKLRFLPYETFGKIKFIVSGRFGEKDFEKRYNKFIAGSTANIDTVALGGLSQEEICQILKPTLSHRCAVGSAAERTAEHLEELKATTPIIVSLCAARIEQSSDSEMQFVMQEYNCSDMVEAYIKWIDSMLVGANGQRFELNFVLYQAVGQIFAEDDMRVFCIAVSKHGVLPGTLNHSFSFGSDELVFYERLYDYRYLLFDRDDGLIDFWYDGFREMFVNRMTEEYKSYCHRMLKSCYFETEVEFTRKFDMGAVYHCIESRDAELIQSLVSYYTVYENDPFDVQLNKQRCLTAIARILRDYLPARFIDSEFVIGLTVGFMRFCETYLFDSYSDSCKDCRNRILMMYELSKIYAGRYEEPLYKCYDADRIPRIGGYHTDAPDEMTVKELALSRSPLLLLYYQLNVLEKVDEYTREAGWRYSNLHLEYHIMKDKLASRFSSVADAYLKLLQKASNFSSPEDFYNKLISAIHSPDPNGAYNQAFSKCESESFDFQGELVKGLESIDPSPRSLRYTVINMLMSCAAKLSRGYEANYIKCEPDKIETTLESFFGSISMIGCGIDIAGSLSEFFHDIAADFISICDDEEYLLSVYDKMIDFSLDYIGLCGVCSYAVDNINTCLIAIETELDMDTPEQFKELKARYFKVADRLIDIYRDREYSRFFTTFDAIEFVMFFSNMKKTFAEYSDMMGDDYYEEYISILNKTYEYSLTFFDSQFFTANYFEHYLALRSVLDDAVEVCKKCLYYETNLGLIDKVKLDIAGILDRILGMFEQREASMGDIKKLGKMGTDFITGITEDETYKLLVEDLNSLINYVEERDELDEEVLALARWNWKRKNIVVIK